MTEQVTVRIGDQEVRFERLTIGDYAAWTARLRAQRQADAQKLMPAAMSPLERFQAARAVEQEEPTLEEMAALLLTPGGAVKALALSLAKAGRGEEEARRIIESLPPAKVMELALDVSSLYERRPATLAQRTSAWRQGQNG
jgi:hypothetical protein